MREKTAEARQARWLEMLLALAFALGLAVLSLPASTERAHAAEEGTVGNCTWVLDDEGTLTITPITGTDGSLPSTFSSYNIPWVEAGYSDDIVRVVFKEGISVQSMSDMFRDYENLKYVEGLSKLDTSETIYMYNMFYGCSSLETVDLSGLDTSAVKYMDSLFRDCSSLKSLDLSDWDVSEVRDMGSMFNSCSSLESLDLSGWDVSGVTSLDFMFYGCSSLKSLDLSGWDVSSAEDTSFMFDSCSSLKSLDLSDWDVSEAKDLHNMFSYCEALESLDLSGWDVSGVEDMSDMFRDCSSLQSLNLSSWGPSAVEDVGYMFYGCSSLESLDLSGWDTSSATDMGSMFDGCSLLKTLTLGGDFEISSNMDLKDYILNETTPERWCSVGQGTIERPQGTCFSSVDELIASHNERGKLETYVVRRVFDRPVAETSFVYDGTSKGCLVSYNTAMILTGDDFATEAGSYKLTISLPSEGVWIDESYEVFSDDIVVEWTISPLPIDDPSITISLSPEAYLYNGEAQEPSVEVAIGPQSSSNMSVPGRALEEGLDYEVAYSDNVNVGVAKAIVTGKGNFAGTVELKFEIVMQKATWEEDSLGKRYMSPDGTYAADCWQDIDGDRYRFDADGYMVTGWYEEDGRWYYLKKSGKMARDQWGTVKGVRYHFDANGCMDTGWLKDGGKWYYLKSSGAMACDQWGKVKGVWYHFGDDGAMTTGWLKDGGKWYYLKASGAMASSEWVKSSGSWYYFNGSGVMQASKWIGNYYVGASGKMLTNQWVGKYYVGADGKWIPGY